MPKYSAGEHRPHFHLYLPQHFQDKRSAILDFYLFSFYFSLHYYNITTFSIITLFSTRSQDFKDMYYSPLTGKKDEV